MESRASRPLAALTASCLSLASPNVLSQVSAATSPSTAASAPEVPAAPTQQVVVNGVSSRSYVVKDAGVGMKIDVPVLETPANVQIVSSQLLQDQQATTLERALQNVSGVVANVWSMYGEESITLRGFNTTTVFEDGFRVIEYGGFGTRKLSDAQSVEVLKGPAAVLYGAIEPGGIVNIVTRQPQATPFHSAEVGAGSWNRVITRLDSTGPLGEDGRVQYRLGADYESTDSWRQFDSQRQYQVAPSLRWALTPRTEATVKLELTHDAYTNDNFEVLPYIDGRYVSLPRRQNLFEPVGPLATDRSFGSLRVTHHFDDDWSLKTQFVVNDVRDHGLTGNIDSFTPSGDTLIAERAIYGISGFEVTRAASADLVGHLTTEGVAHTLLVGADDYWVYNAGQLTLGNTSDIDPFHPVHPGSEVLAVDPSQYFGYGDMTASLGAYLQDTAKLPGGLDVTAGLRYQHVHDESWSSTGPGLGGDGSRAPGTPARDHAVTPRVGLVWEARPWLSAYSHFAGGFAANSGTDYLGQPLKSSRARESELGMKGEAFGGRLRGTLAIYQLTKTNIPTCDSEHDPSHCTAPGAPQKTIGEVRSRGVEFDLQGELAPHWNTVLAWAWTDARVTKSDDTSATSTTFLAGQRMANVPFQMGSLWATHEVTEGALAGWTFGGGVTARGASVDASNTLSTAGYAVTNVVASWRTRWREGHVIVQLNVDNLFDRAYMVGTNWASGASGNVANVTFGTPRSFVATVRYEY